MFDAALLNLPWETLVTLTCGYIGYFVANVGINDGHKATEITFSTLIFGMFSAMVYRAFVWAGVDTWTATFPAVAYAFASGAYWRKYARKWMYAFLRKHDISWSDRRLPHGKGCSGILITASRKCLCISKMVLCFFPTCRAILKTGRAGRLRWGTVETSRFM